ncbi:MAG TPA: DinB family protein [Thermoanaerobaculia bacterium]|jgi:hypothetical protein|nr:DinB family protein [Thermoanaerobaculia bacterium]
MNRRPADTEYAAAFYAAYVSLVPENDILPALSGQSALLRRVADSIPEERETFRYAPEKWSVREVIGHVVDLERVFGFRAFAFSRGETAPLPGFDEKVYVAHSGYDRRSLESLAGDFTNVREANLSFLRRLDAEAWDRVGTANGKPVSVRALAYVMAGHARHHLSILRERYGVGASA